jgi:hypothetical protein
MNSMLRLISTLPRTLNRAMECMFEGGQPTASVLALQAAGRRFGDLKIGRHNLALEFLRFFGELTLDSRPLASLL